MRSLFGKLGVRATCVLILFVFLPTARGEFLTTLTVDVSTTAGDLFLYNYQLANQTKSDLPAVAFSLDLGAGADLTSIDGPRGWTHSYVKGDTVISWESTDIAFDLAPGGRVGFSFTSPLNAGTHDYLIVGLNDVSGDVASNFSQIASPGPMAAPEPSGLLMMGLGGLVILVKARRRVLAG